MNREAVLIIGAVVAVGSFIQGWITTGQPDANLLEAAYVAVGAVVTRYFVYSRKTVEQRTDAFKKHESILHKKYANDLVRLAASYAVELKRQDSQK